MQKIDTLSIGAVGFASAEVAPQVLSNIDATNIVQVIVQVIIGIATLIGMFRKKSK